MAVGRTVPRRLTRASGIAPPVRVGCPTKSGVFPNHMGGCEWQVGLACASLGDWGLPESPSHTAAWKGVLGMRSLIAVGAAAAAAMHAHLGTDLHAVLHGLGQQAAVAEARARLWLGRSWRDAWIVASAHARAELTALQVRVSALTRAQVAHLLGGARQGVRVASVAILQGRTQAWASARASLQNADIGRLTQHETGNLVSWVRLHLGVRVGAGL